MIKEHFKQFVKAIPGFYPVDLARRKMYESSLTDFLVRPLAERLEEWPPKLVVDITNRCNARCVWCLNPLSEMKRGTMSLDLFKKIIEDYADRGGEVWLSTFGEPLMDPTIINKIRFAGKFRSIMETTLLTNALLLDSEVAEALLDAGINLDISLDELDQKRFEEIKGISFTKVITNTISILQRNREAQNPIKILIRLKTSDSLENLKKSPYYAQLEALGARLEVTPIGDTGSIANWGGSFDKRTFFETHLKSKNVFDYHKQYNLRNPAPCSQLWANMVVSWEGKVVLCCVDMESKVVQGDLKKHSIMDVWQGSQIARIRNLAIGRQKREMVLCRDCDLHQGWRYLKKYYQNSENIYREEFVR